MAQTKSKISITIMERLDRILGEISKETGLSKSTIIEKAIEQYIAGKLDTDSKKLASMQFDDLPSEEVWLKLQTEND